MYNHAVEQLFEKHYLDGSEEKTKFYISLN